RPAPTVDATLLPFEQETLDNFEVGLKSRWFNDRLVANLSLFHGNYKAIQQTVFTFDPRNGAFASRVANASKAVVRGAEVEVRGAPWTSLDLRVGLGFTDAQYKDFMDTRQEAVFDANGVRSFVPVPLD